MIENISLFLDNQHSEKTSSTYKWALERWYSFIGDKDDVTETDALAFRKHLEESMKPRSAALVFNTIRVFYRWSGGYNPFERIKSPKRIVNATPAVPEDSLVDKTVDSCYDLREKAILALLLNGLRASEVRNLTPESVWWSEEYQMHLVKVVGKGMRERIIPLSGEAAQVVPEYLKTTDKSQRWLFLNRNGDKLSVRSVEYVVEKHSGGGLMPHRLRHHYATRLVRNGVDAFTLQNLLGHVNIQSTAVYTNLDLSDLVKASRKDPRNEDRL